MKLKVARQIISQMGQDEDERDICLDTGERPVHRDVNHVFAMIREYFEGDARRAIDFMRAHAACTIVCPDVLAVEQLAMEHSISRSLSRNNSDANRARLAKVHNIDRRIVSKVKRDRDVKRKVQHCRWVRRSRLRIQFMV